MDCMKAIAAFGQRLQCPICLTVCTAPVTLPCSHFFCRDCIIRHKDECNAAHHASTLQFRQPKRKAGEFDCPVCRLPCNHRQTTPDDTLDSVTVLFRQLRQLVEDESGMQLSQDVPLYTHSIPPPNNSPPRQHATANGTGTRRRRQRSPVAVSSTGRRGRGRLKRRSAAPSMPMDEEEEEVELDVEEEEDEEEEEEEEEEEAVEEHKEEQTLSGTSETSGSSQKENVDPRHNTKANTGHSSGGRTNRTQQRMEDSMDTDSSIDDIPLLGNEAAPTSHRTTPIASSLSSLPRPGDRAAVDRQTPDLFAPRLPPSTPTYARPARNGYSASHVSTPTKPTLTPLSSSKVSPAASSPRHIIQRATSMSIRRKLTTYTLLTSHLDDDQLALLKELEELINQHTTAIPTVQHPRVVVTASWSPTVTHLVTSASTATASLVTKRTNKYFLAMLSPHVAIVTIDWVTESIVARRLLDGAEYRVKGDTRHPTGGETRRRWNERADDDEGLLAGWQVSELGQWSNKVVRDDVRAIVEVGGGQWLGSDDQAGGVAGKRYVVFDDGKKVGADNRALLSDEVVRSYEGRGISVVPCSWLFDCVSSFSILPTPLPPQASAR